MSEPLKPFVTPPIAGQQTIKRSEVNKRISHHASQHVRALNAEGITDPGLTDGLKNCFEVGCGLGVKSFIPETGERDLEIAKCINYLWAVQRGEYLPPTAPESAEELELVARMMILMKQSFAAGFVCGLCGSNALKGYTITDDYDPYFQATSGGGIAADEWSKAFRW